MNIKYKSVINPFTGKLQKVVDVENMGGAADGLATLDGSSKVPVEQLPATVINDTFVVASQAAMLALTAEVGDLAIRTDLTKTYVLQAVPASTLGNWKELLSAGAVSSVTAGNSSITISPTTGAVVVSLNVANANTWTAAQTIRRDALGASSGDGMVLDNQTNATASVLQASPALRLRGRGFLSNTSSSYAYDFRTFVVGMVNTTKYAKRVTQFSDDGSTWKEGYSYDTNVLGEGFSITTPQSQSNGGSGTTRAVTINNSGIYTWLDYKFSGTRKVALGASSDGNFQVSVSGANGFVVANGSSNPDNAYGMHYLHNSGAYFTGNVNSTGRMQVGFNSFGTPKNFLQVGGSVAHIGRRVKTNYTPTADDHILYVDPSVPSCTGTATVACGTHTSQAACEARNSHGGCTWTTGNCSDYNGNESGCNSVSGCTWETTSCNGFGDESSCNSYTGCSWSSTPTDCGGFSDEMTCNSYAGCSWSAGSDCSTYNNNEGACTGASGCSWSPAYDGDCTAFTDEGSCTSNSGCSWDGSSCTGNYYIGNGTCSGSYGVGCSGTYNVYACSGSYATGNCTGSFGSCGGTPTCGGITGSTDCGNETGCTWSTAVTISLEQISTIMEKNNTVGRVLTIKKDGSSGTVVVQAYSGDDIDGSSSKSISTNYAGFTIHAFPYYAECSGFSSESPCNAQSGCYWTSYCTASIYDDCVAVSGCSWDGSTCSGTAGACGGVYVTNKRWHVVGTF